MAWIEERTRADGRVSACVVWREEGRLRMLLIAGGLNL
jgi:hypothetical protein